MTAAAVGLLAVGGAMQVWGAWQVGRGVRDVRRAATDLHARAGRLRTMRFGVNNMSGSELGRSDSLLSELATLLEDTARSSVTERDQARAGATWFAVGAVLATVGGVIGLL